MGFGSSPASSILMQETCMKLIGIALAAFAGSIVETLIYRLIIDGR